MKKLIALALVIALAVSMAGCCCCLGLQECEICEELAFCQERTLRYTGDKVIICEECYERYDHLFK